MQVDEIKLIEFSMVINKMSDFVMNERKYVWKSFYFVYFLIFFFFKKWGITHTHKIYQCILFPQLIPIYYLNKPDISIAVGIDLWRDRPERVIYSL